MEFKIRGLHAQSVSGVLTKVAVLCMGAQVCVSSSPSPVVYKMLNLFRVFSLLPALGAEPHISQVSHCNEPHQPYSEQHKCSFSLPLNCPTPPNHVSGHDDHANVGPKLSAILPTWEWPWRDLRVMEDSSKCRDPIV